MEPVITQSAQAVTSESIRALNDRIQLASAFVELIDREMEKTIVGQKDMVQKLLVALLADGHVLLEGVPGLAKTLAIKSLAVLLEGGIEGHGTVREAHAIAVHAVAVGAEWQLPMLGDQAEVVGEVHEPGQAE